MTRAELAGRASLLDQPAVEELAARGLTSHRRRHLVHRSHAPPRQAELPFAA